MTQHIPQRRRGDHAQGEVASGIRKWGQRVLIAYLAATSLAGYGLYDLQQQQDRAALAACHRLNLVRASANRSSYASWQFFGLVVHLTATNKARARKAAMAFSRQLAGYRAELTWVPLTRPCSAAVDNPDGYRAPPPVLFDARTPSRSALFVGRGE